MLSLIHPISDGRADRVPIMGLLSKGEGMPEWSRCKCHRLTPASVGLQATQIAEIAEPGLQWSKGLHVQPTMFHTDQISIRLLLHEGITTPQRRYRPFQADIRLCSPVTLLQAMPAPPSFILFDDGWNLPLRNIRIPAATGKAQVDVTGALCHPIVPSRGTS